MGSSKKVTVGYKYYVGMHMILCHGPVDRLLRIQVDERDVWSGSLSGGQVAINRPDIFGGESREGGIQGTVDFETGHAGQGQNSYLLSKLGSYIPSFRGVTGMVLRQIYMGLNPYLKKWSFRLQRIHTRQNGLPQWYDSKAEMVQPDVGISVNEDFSDPSLFETNDPGGYIVESNSIRNSGSVAGSFDSFFERGIRNLIVKKISVEFRVERVSAGDSMRIAIASDNGSAWLSFNPVREALVDPLQRPTINGNTAAESHLDEDVWFRLEVEFEQTSPYFQFKIIRLSDSQIISSGQYAKPPSGWANSLRFLRDQDAAPSITRFRNLEITGSESGSDMNPAHIIRECLTDPLWGMGYLDADIDDVSFMAAADTLYTEGFGMSLLWDTETSIEEFIKIIVKHVDASVYVD